jgi:quercetin dioxygenase-like cupin family protein
MSHTILQPSFTRSDQRGILRELLNQGVWQSILQGEMVTGAVMGNHYHQQTQVFFFMLSGQVEGVTENVQTQARDHFILNALEGVILQPNISHKLTFAQGGAFLLLKSLPYDPQNPDTFHYPVE